METYERNLIVSRIASGYTRLKIDGVTYKLFSPNKDVLYEAEELYSETYQAAKDEGVLDDKEILELLVRMGKWNDKLEVKLNETVPKYIETAKLEMLDNFKDKAKLETIRKYLRRGEQELEELFSVKNQFSNISCHGTASFSKTQFLIQRCLDKPCEVNSVLMWLNSNCITESQIREIARSDPWRTIYSCKKLDNIFNIPTCEYSIDMRRLVSWSLLFDAIFETENISNEILEDDDVFDAVLIRKRNKDKAESVKNEYQDKLDRHAGASDVFIPVDYNEIPRASLLNGVNERAIISNRLKVIRESKGPVGDESFSDVRLQLAMLKNNLGTKNG